MPLASLQAGVQAGQIWAHQLSQLLPADVPLLLPALQGPALHHCHSARLTAALSIYCINTPKYIWITFLQRVAMRTMQHILHKLWLEEGAAHT